MVVQVLILNVSQLLVALKHFAIHVTDNWMHYCQTRPQNPYIQNFDWTVLWGRLSVKSESITRFFQLKQKNV